QVGCKLFQGQGFKRHTRCFGSVYAAVVFSPVSSHTPVIFHCPGSPLQLAKLVYSYLESETIRKANHNESFH
ncbi:MAG TPA: hypothetical protein VFK30_06315, partial [Anaerolineae bacterium]|nr:hypothetical protein [Anaerolineae bacterium]